MAEWLVRVPGGPERVVAVPPGAKAFVIGRAEGCDLVLPEKKASKRHAELSPLAGGGGWVLVDLQTSNGTYVGEHRVLRAVVQDGDSVRIGDSTLEFRAGRPSAPAPAPTGSSVAVPGSQAGASPARPAIVLASNLRMDAAAPPAPAADAAEPVEDAFDEEPPSGVDSTIETRRAHAAGRDAVRRGVVILAIGLAAVALSRVVAGGEAERRARLHAESVEYKGILEQSDAPFALLRERVADFKRAHPASALGQDLDNLLELRRASHDAGERAEAELDSVQRDVGVRPESEVVGRLVALRQSLGDDARFTKRIEILLDAVEHQRAEALGRERAAAEADADRAIARGDPSSALRRLRAFRAARPGLAEDALAAIARKEAAARATAVSLATAALQRAEGVADPDARRRVLVEAMAGLEATEEGDRLRSAMTRITGGAIATPTPSGPAGATPGIPTPSRRPEAGPPAATDALLARAAEANGLARDRAWAKAAAEYEALAAVDAAPRMKQDWAQRAQDLRRVASLVSDLADAVAAAGEHPLRIALAGGTFDVVAADATGVRLRRADKTADRAWPTVEPADLLALLGHGKPTPDRHLALAVLAADLGDRRTAVEHLVPLVALESHRALAFDAMARRLDGRTAVPQGGYQVLDGDLVDAAEYAKRVEAKHVASLRLEAGALVDKVAADPVFRRVAALRAKRDELDKRRAYALLAIFDERHWPYPHPPEIMGPYEQVWGEIVKRTKAVAEAWDDREVVKVPASGDTKKLVDRHAAVVAELAAKGVDVEPLRKAIEPYAPYVGETLTIRTFFRTPDEKELLAYNRWVVDVFNPSKTAVIAPLEREEVRITNDYRAMMGFTIRVDPAPEPISAIDGQSVVKILDKNHEVDGSRVLLHAVRIDDRLVSSARGHSMDMGARGYFAHEAPGNPKTGEPATTPFDRMIKAGYRGMAMSENIAKAGGAQPAHDEWLHSSGHHRNILSDWADLGVGQSGNLWTQNFGSGGGPALEIPGSTPPSDGDSGGEPRK